MKLKNQFLIAGLFAAAACTSQNVAEPTPELTDEVAAEETGQTPAGLEAQGWSKVRPGGDVACTDGSEFYFMVRPGRAEQILFYLEGGGGCWNKASCNPEGTPTAKLNLIDQEEPDEGIFDADNAENPFADYTSIYVPYCSGDVHLGANDVVYPGTDDTDQPLPVFHRGRANAQSAIDWVTQNYAAPDTIFVTGVSAGGVPTPLYASILANNYEDARVASLGDGAGGYRRKGALPGRLENWGILNHLNAVPAFEDISEDTWSYEQLYINGAEAHPDITFARFDYSADPAQWRFLSGNSEYDTLLGNMLANNDDIRDAVPNFRAYIAEGEAHTVMQKPEFYTLTSSGVRLVDWVAQLASGEPVDDVLCEACTR